MHAKLAKQLTCTNLCVISPRRHSFSVADIFLWSKKKNPILKIDVNTTNEQHQNLLHSIYCDAVHIVNLSVPSKSTKLFSCYIIFSLTTMITF